MFLGIVGRIQGLFVVFFNCRSFPFGKRGRRPLRGDGSMFTVFRGCIQRQDRITRIRSHSKWPAGMVGFNIHDANGGRMCKIIHQIRSGFCWVKIESKIGQHFDSWCSDRNCVSIILLYYLHWPKTKYHHTNGYHLIILSFIIDRTQGFKREHLISTLLIAKQPPTSAA